MKSFIWFAGLYEGEGSCHFYDGSIAVQIQMTDEDVLRSVQEVVGGNVRGPYDRSAGNPHMTRKNGDQCPLKDMYGWYATGSSEDKYWLLRRLKPLLHGRRQAQVEEVMQRWLEHKGYEVALWRSAAPTKYEAILHLHGMGLGAKRIAKELGIKVDLVKYHLKKHRT